MNPDRSLNSSSSPPLFNVENPASPRKQVTPGSDKKERSSEAKEWNDRGSTKVMKRSCLFLFYALAKVVHAVRDTTHRKATEDSDVVEYEVHHPYSPIIKPPPPRVDREGTPLTETTQKYEAILIEVVPLVTHLAGRKGEGLLRLGDKHSRPVRRVLMSLQKVRGGRK